MNKKFNSFTVCMTLLLSSCAFKQHNQTTQSAAKSEEVLEARYDWSEDTGLRLGEKSKAIRKLISIGDSIYASDSPITLPELIPDPVYIVTALPTSLIEKASFTKAKLKIADKNYQLKTDQVFSDLPSHSVTFSISGLGSAFEQGVSESGILLIEMYTEKQKQLTYSLEFRTPPSKLAFEFIDPRTIAKDLSLSHQMIAPAISGMKAGMVSVLKITNSESIAVDITIPRNLPAELSQEVVRKNYTDLECHGGDFKYWQTTWKDVYSNNLISESLDENLILNLSRIANENSSTLTVSRIPPNGVHYVGFYSISENAWQLMNGTPLASTARVQHVPAGCFKLPPVYRDDTTHRFFQDIAIGDIRGAVATDFKELVPVSMRFSDLSPADDFGMRVLHLAPGLLIQQ